MNANPAQQQVPDQKRFSTIQAALALRGFEVRACDGGGWFVTRWNLTRFCRGVEDLESFLVVTQ